MKKKHSAIYNKLKSLKFKNRTEALKDIVEMEDNKEYAKKVLFDSGNGRLSGSFVWANSKLEHQFWSLIHKELGDKG